MVYLALSAAAAHEILEHARASGASVWVGSDGLSEAEYQMAGESGIDISRFVYPLAGADAATIERSIETVVQHHASETLWVENRYAPG